MRRATLLLYALLLACRSNTAGETPDEQELVRPEQAAAEHEMAGTVSNEDLHLRLTPLRRPARGDSARAAQILATMRQELVKYRDVRVAEADGFRQFLPGAALPIQHFTNVRFAFQSRDRLDPARPTSLLYERAADSSLTLVGAMFTAPPQTSDGELDARVPLSIARWHQHINWCLPRLAEARQRWRETRNGQPVFGPKSPIATAQACEAVGGRFRPRMFGWMVHVMAFSPDDPWNAHRH